MAKKMSKAERAMTEMNKLAGMMTDVFKGYTEDAVRALETVRDQSTATTEMIAKFMQSQLEHQGKAIDAAIADFTAEESTEEDYEPTERSFPRKAMELLFGPKDTDDE